MNVFFELGDRFAAKSSWKDFALTKFCLFAMGVIVGVLLPKKGKGIALGTAAGVFLASYVPLMAKMFRIAKEMAGGDKGYEFLEE